jgi:hypothetical protein
MQVSCSGVPRYTLPGQDAGPESRYMASIRLC